MFRAFMSLPLFLVLTVPAGAAERPIDLIRSMGDRYEKVIDYTAVFHKQEIVKDDLLPRENILVKFRRPFSISMKWLQGPNEGREIFYIRGKNQGKLFGHEGGFFGFITYSLDPQGAMAMQGNRYPITAAGIGNLIDRIVGDVNKAEKKDALRVRDWGMVPVFGRKSQMFTLNFRNDSGLGFSEPRIDVWVGTESGLPIQAEFFDVDGNKVGSYAYRNLKVNIGLTDKDFEMESADTRSALVK